MKRALQWLRFQWETSLGRLSILLAAIVSLLLVVVFTLYRVKFPGGLSYDPSDWITFGTCIGGTLGPAFSLLAFWGLIYTVYHQTKQTKISEINHILDEIAARIENLRSEFERIDAEAVGQPLTKEENGHVEKLGSVVFEMARKLDELQRMLPESPTMDQYQYKYRMLVIRLRAHNVVGPRICKTFGINLEIDKGKV
jgi:hypothetical protein